MVIDMQNNPLPSFGCVAAFVHMQGITFLVQDRLTDLEQAKSDILQVRPLVLYLIYKGKTYLEVVYQVIVLFLSIYQQFMQYFFGSLFNNSWYFKKYV